MSLITGLIMLAGVMFLDFFRTLQGNQDDVTVEPVIQKEEIEAAPVLQSDPLDLNGTATSENENKNEASRIRISVFGNVLLHENVLKQANQALTGTEEIDYAKGFDFKPMFSEVKDLIESTDLSLINQASLVGANDAPSALCGYPAFNGPSSILDDYAALGFDGVNMATNHALDTGGEGWKNAVSAAKDKSITTFGTYQNKEEIHDIKNKVINLNGIRLSFLSYVTETNMRLLVDEDIGIPYGAVKGGALNKKMIREDIAACKECSDIVIVWINWANDASFESSDFQKDTAIFLANAGADVILGNGPKALQKTEWITSDSGKKTLCSYSLGNSLCTMQYIENLLGGILIFDVEKDESGASIKNVVIEPTMIEYDETIRNIKLIRLNTFTEDRFDRHGSNVLYGKGKYSWLTETINKQIEPLFMPAAYR